jgi:hypothetical protein
LAGGASHPYLLPNFMTTVAVFAAMNR